MQTVIETRELTKHYPITSGLFRRVSGHVRAVDEVNIAVEEGKTLGLVGESGSGKTTLGRLITGLETPTSGSIIFQGKELSRLTKTDDDQSREKIQMVFQDASASLNPRRRIRGILLDSLLRNKIETPSTRSRMIDDALETVGLPADFADKFPYHLSGGQRQRVAIARALISRPDVIVLDEPTSSLDVSVQANIISLLEHLQREMGFAYIFISHNLSLVRAIADDVAVMYLGRIVEMSRADELFTNPMHPYSTALLSMIPTISEDEQDLLPRRMKLVGEIPSQSDLPNGCRFVTRCPLAMPVCDRTEPDQRKIEEHSIRCFLF